jgi:hypothetical protein
MQNSFYVYKHIRKDTDHVFYVGKGTKNRAWSKMKRNRRWEFISNFGYTVDIIQDNLSETDSFKLEIETIAFYKNQGQCEANFAIGGIGGNTFVNKTIEELELFKVKMSKITSSRPVKCLRPLKGPEHPMWGKSNPYSGHTVEGLEKLRQSKLGNKNPMYNKSGELHPRFAGWWITPAGRFASLKEAEIANNSRSVKHRCKRSKSTKFKE